MPGGHVSQRHRLFLHRQLRAGRPKATIARNYRAFQVRLARIRELPSVSTLKRIKRQGGWPDGRPAKRHNIGESLEARHKKLIEKRLAWGRHAVTDVQCCAQCGSGLASLIVIWSVSTLASFVDLPLST